MNKPAQTTDWIADEFVNEVRTRLRSGKRVRRTLPDGGRLHIDRQLPFLCVYRQPMGQTDDGTSELVEGEASFLIATASKRATADLSDLVHKLVEALSDQFDAFLILEIWSAPDKDVAIAADEDDILPTELQPDFVISARGTNTPQRTLATFRRHLERVSILKQKASVQIEPAAEAHPPKLPYLLKAQQCKTLNCDTIGLCVRPIYRDHDSGVLFPGVLHDLKRGLGRAFKQTFFTFAKTRTNASPKHFYSLGRRAMVKSVWDVDRRLSEISDSFDFLLQVTPVNAEAAWREFRRKKFQTVPRFYYRPLAVEPAVLKRQLFDVHIEHIEDPTLAELFRQRQDELDRKITMLTDVGTPRFLLGSRQVYGDIDANLLDIANELLRRLSSRSREDSGGQLSAQQFAEEAEQEIAFYRAQMPSFAAKAEVREDIFSGLLCSGGNLLIGHRASIPRRRVQALLQHEVGTHLLTYYNGLTEPFQQLHSGFAGYDALQEGLAVLTEYLVGGLSSPRMRMLAARVVAAQMLVDGATFIDTFNAIDRDYDFSQRIAYTITMRTYRGGGLTKDAVYLRGLMEMLEYLKGGGELEPLFIGKIAADHISLIQELRHRNVLKPPAIRPRYLEMPDVPERLNGLRNGVAVTDLVKATIR
ncbi:MAG: flavohemoglobin expression-modulating QEGLA motif protein [Planctomycetes bacterium]|nr:flavohemoglobin expression-modulating QEGLA motif protein [Planctomycetota bacterium]